MQVEIVFTDALAAEGLLELVEARADGTVDPAVDDEARPILLAVSDNGPQMSSGSTREFMAMCAIAQHFGRPGTPTDQAWIESFNGHLKAENPHLLAITDPVVLRPSLSSSGSDGMGCDCTPGSGTSHPTTSTKDGGPPSARPERPGSKRRACDGSPTIEVNTSSNPTGDPKMSFDRTGISISRTQKRVTTYGVERSIGTSTRSRRKPLR